ncbi:hypothetical protein [Pectobacterium brasiliense]|nr:hypothetical protein [Pectobacterium brasiliense]
MKKIKTTRDALLLPSAPFFGARWGWTNALYHYLFLVQDKQNP